MMRGQVVQAAQSNAGGTLLALLAMFTGPWLIVSTICGKWVVVQPHDLVIGGIGVVVIAVTLVDWIIRNFVL